MVFLGTATDRNRFIHATALFAAALALSYACTAQPTVATGEQRIRLEGLVRTVNGDPIPNAFVFLQRASDTKFSKIQADAQGHFIFFVSEAGSYFISAEKAGWRKFEPQAVIAQANGKRVDLVLSPLQVDIPQMELDDRPSFTIAGLTDWSGAGGHGSETRLRASEALAKQTLELKSADKNESANVVVPLQRLGADTETTLRADRERIQKLLATQNRADLHRMLGDLDEQLADPITALHEYEEATHLDPSEENYFSWGTELLLHRAPAAAVEVFAKGSAAFPRSAKMRAGLGVALYSTNSFEQAAQNLCAASDLEPGRAEFYSLLAEIEKTATGTPTCMEQSLARFVRLQPDNAYANFYYAITLWKLKRGSPEDANLRRAEALLEKAIAINPKFGEAYLQLGLLRGSYGDLAKARGLYKTCTEVSPNLSECHYRLALAYRKSGETDKASDELRKYHQTQTAESATIEQERSNLRQFLIVLKHKSSAVQQ